MSRFLKLYLVGQDGSRWNLTDETEGVMLRPGPTKLIDAPARTFWLETSVGSYYQGVQFPRRDPVFSVQIYHPDPDVWADLDSRFRIALGIVGEHTFWMEAHTSYGVRKLEMRLLSEPTAYEGEGGGHDPFLTHDSTLTISAACEKPFWESAPLELEWALTSGTSGTGTLMFENRGDVPVFWRGFATAPAHWRVPDRSWGQTTQAKAVYPYNRAADDAARMEWLPTLLAGEDVSIETNPDLPTLIAANGSPVQNRWESRGLIYPIKPWTLPTPVTVQVEGASPGAGIRIWIPRRFSRPFGMTI